jgi:hypothetical protein
MFLKQVDTHPREPLPRRRREKDDAVRRGLHYLHERRYPIKESVITISQST